MKKVIFQVLFWVVFFFVWQQLVYFYVDNLVNRWLFTAFDTGLVLMAFYALYGWVTPQWFHRSSGLIFASGVVAVVLGTAGLVYLVMEVFLHRGLVPIHFNLSWDYRSMEQNRIFIAILGAGAGFTAQLSARWLQARKRAEQTEKEKIASELTYLRAQVNPHFLFNSINTIYVQMSLPGEEARQTLATFSDMLRYQLYECTGESVPLDKEIDYLRQYIHLQRLRKDERYRIEFLFEGEPGDNQIAPFLLLPFVENMFKHVSNNSDGGNLIEGRFSLEPGRLTFHGVNTKSGTTSLGGIGLANVRRRLDLLYPRLHTLTITDHRLTYEVCLDLQLR